MVCYSLAAAPASTAVGVHVHVHVHVQSDTHHAPLLSHDFDAQCIQRRLRHSIICPYQYLNCSSVCFPPFPAGIGALVSEFAAPGDAEYEPPREAAEHLPQQRMFRNKELELQVRLDDETKLEKWVPK
jgi:hypothetical protein